MDYDTRKLVEALGRIAESIAMRLRDMATSKAGERWTESEFGDVARTLEEIENRLYRKGEYAPEKRS
jgi:hypothetical protein